MAEEKKNTEAKYSNENPKYVVMYMERQGSA